MDRSTVQHISFERICHFIFLKLKAYFEVMKFRLSFLVAFSSGFGYALGVNGQINWHIMGILCVGGFLISGASVTLNQVMEKDLDGLMSRTKDRPLPTMRISPVEGIVFALIVAVIGFSLLAVYTNLFTTLLAFVSMLLYSFAYTPLKQVGPVAVLVGAVPGALPPMLGWIAATGSVDYQALIIFGIQFIWQFPHFWAIAWVADEDYRKAGFKLLPSGGGRDINTAFQIMIYTLFLIPLGLLPTIFGISGATAGIITTVCGVLFFAQTFYLMKKCSQKAAKYIMFGSFLYLPIVQIALVMDKV